MEFDKQDSISALKTCMVDLGLNLHSSQNETSKASFFNLSKSGKGDVKVTFIKRNEAPFIDLGNLLYGFQIKYSTFNPSSISFTYDKPKLTIESENFKFSLTF